MDFLIAEKGETYMKTRHWFGAVNSKYTEEAGVKVNPLRLMNELCRYSSGKADPRVIKMWIDESYKTVNMVDRILTDYGYVCDFTSDIGADPTTEDAYTYLAPIEHYYHAGPDCSEEVAAWGRNGIFEDYIKKAGHEPLYNHELVTLEKDGDKVVGGIFRDTVNGNYVRIKVMPEPIKRRYYREHIAYLIIILTLKHSLSIALIQRIIPTGLSREEVARIYTEYAARHRLTARYFLEQTRRLAGPILEHDDADEMSARTPEALIVTNAVMSGFTRLLTEKLLLLEGKDLSDGGAIERLEKQEP